MANDAEQPSYENLIDDHVAYFTSHLPIVGCLHPIIWYLGKLLDLSYYNNQQRIARQFALLFNTGGGSQKKTGGTQQVYSNIRGTSY